MNPLPPSGPAKEIFVRALREFSDSCQPPALKPTCPFSTETHPGVRGCGEECMDLLASFESGEAAERTEVSLGDGIALRPRHRARRGPDPSARAMDALLKACAGKSFDDLRDTAIVRLLVDSTDPAKSATSPCGESEQ